MYHTVRIRDLSPQRLSADDNRARTGNKIKSSSISDDFWMHYIDKSDDEEDRYFVNRNPHRLTFVEANGPHTHIIRSGHAVFEAYLAAYNAHEDLVLSPDDIWLMITIYYSRYVVDHAERMRHLFVDHTGKKELTIKMMTMEPDWPNFLIAMRNEIGKHVKSDVVELLRSNFSTTGPVEGLLSSACIMHTFKKYFDYTQVICGCGIRNVHFLGTLNDWRLLRDKTEALKNFTLHSDNSYSDHRDFRKYLDGVLPILDQFIQTYQGHVDNQFWDGIFDYTKVNVTGGSGMLLTVDGVRGWFLRLCYGHHLSSSRGTSLRDIGLGAISVPVKLINLVEGGKESSCHVVGGFHGIHSSDDGKHRPVMSFAVYENHENQTS